MPPERKVDRDAAVAVPERGDDVAPQPMVRERPREEDERRPSAGRLPGQRPETGFQSSRFHANSSFVMYPAYTCAADPTRRAPVHWYLRAVPGRIRVARRSGPRMTISVSTRTPTSVIRPTCRGKPSR